MLESILLKFDQYLAIHTIATSNSSLGSKQLSCMYFNLPTIIKPLHIQ
jgi:hypothetical protein